MRQNSDHLSKSFRVTKNFPISSFRYRSEEKTYSITSSQSQFTNQYNGLAHRLNIKPITRKGMLSVTSTKLRHKNAPSSTLSYSSLQKNTTPIKEPMNYIVVPSKFTNLTQGFKGLEYNREHLKSHKKKYLKAQQPSIYNEYTNDDPINPLKSKNLFSEQTINIKPNLRNEKERLLGHVQRVLNVYTSLNQEVINIKNLQRDVKAYVLQKNQDKIFTSECIFENQNGFKFGVLIAHERAVVIAIIDLIYKGKLANLSGQCRMMLNSVLGIYSGLISGIQQSKVGLDFSLSKTCKCILQKLSQENIQSITNITDTISCIFNKIHALFRYSQELVDPIKAIITNSKKISINRTFYNLLTIYAAHLNKGPLKDLNTNFLRTFATCPSPFIPKPREPCKQFTLIVDLDETLVHSNLNNGKYSIKYRNHAKEFISNLSKYYEIVVFTSSVSSYADQILDNFKGISYRLYRQHTIKTRGDTIKDIHRIGRPIESMLIIDNLSQNLKLQSENSIMIKSWYGDPNDNELLGIKKLLIDIVNKKTKDVRQYLKQYQS